MSERSRQNVRNTTNVDQSEYQGLVVRNSHTVTVTQTEVQGLVLVQAALQAAIEAAIVVLGSNSDNNIKQLQKVAQSLDVSQMQKQTIVIEDSGEVIVNQTEVQVDVVVQASINLLAQLLLKIA
ncbi:spore coat protein [Bacillus sp. FJAT-29937]|uniref:spore coat protein n=1 Tax=Bacillus sp. FJAT-29937 TaxID=1720553 RepID=UPI0008344B8F|nr:spore coat protein [Bacillus sp. FJAT-29937]